MKINRIINEKALPFLAILIIWLFFSSPYFIQGRVPFASTYQVNFFPPWSGYSELAGPVKNNAQPDVITQIYPWRIFSVDELKQGRIPLWNPYSFSGTPHLANYQSAVFSPFNILFLFLSNIDAWSIIVLLQPLLAAIGMYLFARSLKISYLGSFLSSISFMFCGFITTWMGYATLGYAILFLPYALYAIQKYFLKSSFVFLLLLSLSIAFSFLSGHFQISTYLLVFVFLFFVYKFFPVYNSRKAIHVLSFLVAGVLLAMPQILPTVEFYTLAVRSELFRQTEVIPWENLPTLLAPDFFGNPVTRNNWFGHYAEWNGYIGVVGILFALLAAFNYKKRDIVFFLATAIFSLLLAFNTPLASLLVALKIPVLSTSAAGRIIVLLSFSLAVLAGFGFDTLIQYAKKGKWRIYAWIALVFTIFLLLLFYSQFGLPDLEKTLIARKNLIISCIVAIIVVSYALLSVFIKSKKIILFATIILVSVSTFDVLRFAKKWQAFDPKEVVFKDVKTTDYYKSKVTEKRFLGDFTAENSVYYKLQTLGGYDPLYPEAYGEFVMYVKGEELKKPDRSVVDFPKDGLQTPSAINFLGVSYIVEKISDENQPWGFPFRNYPQDQFNKIYDDGVYRVYENKKAFPRAFVVSNAIYASDKKEQLIQMFTHDLSKTAISGDRIDGLDNGSSGSAQILEYQPNKVVVNVEASGKSLLILTDNFYPGWKVLVNNVPKKLLKIDYNFRGVMVPEGKSTVVMEYLPQSFFVGVYLGLLGTLIIVTSFVVERLRKKK